MTQILSQNLVGIVSSLYPPPLTFDPELITFSLPNMAPHKKGFDPMVHGPNLQHPLDELQG